MGGSGAKVGSGASWAVAPVGSLLEVVLLFATAGFPEWPKTAQPKKKAPRLAAVIQPFKSMRKGLFFIVYLDVFWNASHPNDVGQRSAHSDRSG